MAFFLIAFIVLCLYWFLRSVNRMFGFITKSPKISKNLKIVKKEPRSSHYYVKEDDGYLVMQGDSIKKVKPEPEPTSSVINIQNNYNTTQILIIETKKD